MTLPIVGILSPGDMGHAVGRVLVENGVKVITCLEGRSNRTRQLAVEAGIEAVPTYGQLVHDANMILSILVPAEAKNAATLVSKALEDIEEQVIYVDCNAIAPATVREIEKIIVKAGSRFVDAGIIGGPPNPRSPTRIYASGTDAGEFGELNKYGLDVRIIGKEIGQASGLKMVYAAMTKGTSALSIELLVVAWRMGLYEALMAEWQLSQKDRYDSLSRSLQSVPHRARRWVGEMEEIAKTFASVGLTPKIFEGAADLYRFIGNNPVADETPETYDKNRTLEQLIQTLAEG
jgi:3-hydroxyisobutyrate dehydrogenase-like beta-hydroxyacid dehydrogenase